MKIRFIFLLSLFLCQAALAADYLQTIPAAGNECVGSITQLSSGNILAAGVDFTNNDPLLLSLNSSGRVLKAQRYAAPAEDEASTILRTSDGGAVVGGSTGSFGAGLTDSFLMKLRANGSVAWKRTFGTSGNEHIVRVVETSDRAFIVLADADHDPNLNDIVIAKFNFSGGLIWRKVISAGTFDHPSDLQLTSDNGVIVAIAADTPAGLRSVVVKINGSGVVQWARMYGASGSHGGLSVVQTADGGYYFTEIFTATGTQIGRAVLSRLDANGVVLWSKAFQSAGVSINVSVTLDQDGNPLLVGNMSSPNGSNSRGIIVGLNTNGAMLWRKRVKPDARPVFLGRPSILSDGSILIAGCAGERATSNMDSLIVKTKSNGTIQGGCSGLISFPLSSAVFNLTSTAITVQEIPVPFLMGQAGFQVATVSVNSSPVCSAE